MDYVMNRIQTMNNPRPNVRKKTLVQISFENNPFDEKTIIAIQNPNKNPPSWYA